METSFTGSWKVMVNDMNNDSPKKWEISWVDFRYDYPERRKMTIRRKSMESAIKYAVKKHPKMWCMRVNLV